ncbi:hypothetical protein J4403_01730 [Candidatus Woesearchaeota archaeon]|nr:hypothetical protein [Candidatus Woesearchaeota archaeon]
MKYKDAIKQSMEELIKDDRVMFVGYNINYGSRAYGTLAGIPQSRCLETPLAENLMTSMAMGMSLQGYRPIVFFERHDFVLVALDSIINHIDKIEKLSHGQYQTPVIIRAVVGSNKPIDPGLQHTQDFTEMLKSVISFPVIELKNSKQIIEEYAKVLKTDQPTMFIERKNLYDLDL